MQALLGKLADLETRLLEIEEVMSRPEVSTDYEQVQKLAKERASLDGLVTMYRQYRTLDRERTDAVSIIQEGADAAMTELAKDEMAGLDERLAKLEVDLRQAILPRNPNDEKDVIVEVREGVGGQEAGLFAAELFRMYTRYAALKGWEVELLDSNPSNLGGFKGVVFEVKGRGAFSRLKYERGGHRVQRVPVTESSGRIHTSTATVAVLPEADEVDVQINPEELRIDIFHAGGHGGQNVNKVATAVRIVHIPTGTMSVCQDERSQFKNKQKAMAILRARLYEAEQRKRDTEISESRRTQVGSGDRAEKVRTYNFPQDRITDHRAGISFHGIQRLLDGDLDELVDTLSSQEQAGLL